MSGLSFLEKKSISSKVVSEYRKELDMMVEALHVSVDTIDESELDSKVVGWFEELYLNGHQAHKGEKMLAALMFFHPGYSKGGQKKIPKTWRALRGWRKLTPARSRKPYPLGAWCAIASALVRRAKLTKALWVLLSVSTYARPGEMMHLTVGDLLPPVRHVSAHWTIVICPEGGRSSKVGTHDDSIKVDSSWLTWIAPVLEKLVAGRSPLEPLWDFSYPELVYDFRIATIDAGIPGVVPYQARHSGASIDRATQERTLPEVKKRGRWASDKSVNRYEKHGRLQSVASKFTPQQQAHFEDCRNRLEAIVRFGKTGRLGVE